MLALVLVGGGKGIDELDVEGLDGAERTGVGLPVKVSKREAGYQAGSEELVDIVWIEILDCKLGEGFMLAAVKMRRNAML